MSIQNAINFFEAYTDDEKLRAYLGMLKSPDEVRNFLKEMEPGDMVFFYQSVTEPIGVAGLAVVHGKAVPDPTQFDRRSRYFDERSSRDKPVWFCPEIRFVKQFRVVTGLDELRRKKGLEKMTLLKRGNRLSVMPVSEKEFGLVMELVKQ